MSVIFWLSLFLIGYTFAGYPILLRVLVGWKRTSEARRKDRRKREEEMLRSRMNAQSTVEKTDASESKEESPAISIVLIVYNEAERIEARIANLDQCDYAGERELVVICGGCTDDTAALARAWKGGMAMRVIETEGRNSKAAGLNRGVAEASHGLIVFADARQQFNRHALRKLTAPFSDPDVGAVSGNLDIATSEDGAGAGIDAYWKLERLIRRLESDFDSVIGCTGAIYALRKECFEPLPVDTILDDVVIPMRVLVAGKRVLFESEALAFDPQNLAPDTERKRKIRTLAGNYQMLFRYPSWLSPNRNRAWWQVISHKYLRLAGPFFLAACLISSAILAGDSFFYRLALGGQLICYAFAAFGMMFRGIRSPLFTAPAGFVFLQWQGLRALFHYLRLRKSSEAGVW